jgi:uncharacterized protein
MSDEGQQPPSSRRDRWRGILWHGLRCLLIAYLLVILLLMFLEESLIFIPLNYPTDDWEPGGLKIEDANFETADGTRLHGWYVPHQHGRAAILFCHGNAGNVTHRADTLRLLHDACGASVLCFDYRGYGRSQGKPSEQGVLADARAARAWLARREKIPERQIVLMGESIGCGVAVDLAADGARGLVLENGFTSLPDVAAYHYRWLPVRWLMRTRFDSAAKIGNYHGPLLQSHSEHDTIIPLEIGKRLFQAANEPKQFMLIAGCDHNDPRGPDYYRALSAFLASLP